MYSIVIFVLSVVTTIVIATDSPLSTSTIKELDHKTQKRSFNFEYPLINDEYSTNYDAPLRLDSLSSGPWASPRSYAPSPMEVATAIANAKQASANVLIAQQQVQAAKENVLHQQRIAAEKEAHSSILTQKSETVAAIQRSEAAAAAQSVILAQQRLAAAKNAVAQQQRLASAQEAKAAAALHNSAHAAAAEIRRTEQQAARLAAIQRTGSAAAAHHLSATKDSTIGPINAGNNHVQNYPLALSIAPWNNFGGAIANSGHSIGGWPSATTVYVPPSSAGGSTSFKPAYNVWG